MPDRSCVRRAPADDLSRAPQRTTRARSPLTQQRRRRRSQRGVIIYLTAGDAAFPPGAAAASELVYPGGLRHDVVGLPAGVLFTEMVRDLDAAPTESDSYDRVVVGVMKCAAFWCAARRVELDVEHLRPRIDALMTHLRTR